HASCGGYTVARRLGPAVPVQDLRIRREMNRAVPPSCASRGPAGEGRSDSQRETLVADRLKVWIIEPSPTRAQVAEAQLGARTDSYGHAARAVATADQLMTPRRPVIE